MATSGCERCVAIETLYQQPFTYKKWKKKKTETFLNFNNKSVKCTIIFWYIVHIHEFPIKNVLFTMQNFSLYLFHNSTREKIKWLFSNFSLRNKKCYRKIYSPCCGVDLCLVHWAGARADRELLKLMTRMSNAPVARVESLLPTTF